MTTPTLIVLQNGWDAPAFASVAATAADIPEALHQLLVTDGEDPDVTPDPETGWFGAMASWVGSWDYPTITQQLLDYTPDQKLVIGDGDVRLTFCPLPVGTVVNLDFQ